MSAFWLPIRPAKPAYLRTLIASKTAFSAAARREWCSGNRPEFPGFVDDFAEKQPDRAVVGN